MKLLRKIMLTILSISMFFAAGPATAIASTSNSENVINENELEEILEILEKTPDYLLEDEVQLDEYLLANKIYHADDQKEANEILNPQKDMIVTYGAWDDLKCSASIAIIIGGAGAAIKGVKTLVKAAGSVKALASALALYMRTGEKPEFVKNDINLWNMLKSAGESIMAFSGLENCVQEAS